MAWAARISPTVLMAAVLGGFVVRMALVAVAIFAVKDQSWVELPLLAFSLLITHLGLLFWETRYVSASLAFPGSSRVRGEGGSTLVMLGLEFPPVSHVIEWPDLFLAAAPSR